MSGPRPRSAGGRGLDRKASATPRPMPRLGARHQGDFSTRKPSSIHPPAAAATTRLRGGWHIVSTERCGRPPPIDKAATILTLGDLVRRGERHDRQADSSLGAGCGQRHPGRCCPGGLAILPHASDYADRSVWRRRSGRYLGAHADRADADVARPAGPDRERDRRLGHDRGRPRRAGGARRLHREHRQLALARGQPRHLFAAL